MSDDAQAIDVARPHAPDLDRFAMVFVWDPLSLSIEERQGGKPEVCRKFAGTFGRNRPSTRKVYGFSRNANTPEQLLAPGYSS